MSKESKAKRHHYVPRCYLKNFMTGDVIYTLDIKSLQEGLHEPIKKNHPNKICLEENFYTIDTAFKPTTFKLDDYDALFVESTVLHGAENKYQLTLNKLLGQNAISMADAMLLSDFLLQLKIRNPYWLKEIITKYKDQWIESALEEIYREGFRDSARFAALPDEIKRAVLEGVKEDHKNNETFAKQMQLYGLIMRSASHGERNEKFRTAMIDCKWELFTVPENGPFFITSDNPGFGVKTDGLIYNSNFTGDFIYYLPLTKRHCLAINGFIKDLSYTNKLSDKKIFTVPVNHDHIIKINNYSMQRNYRMLITSDNWYLSQIADINKSKSQGI